MISSAWITEVGNIKESYKPASEAPATVVRPETTPTVRKKASHLYKNRYIFHDIIKCVDLEHSLIS